MKVKKKTVSYNKIINKEIDIIICVDMLGERFDLLKLKIAAFQDLRKNHPITLPCIGHYAGRKYDEKLGDKTIIAKLTALAKTNELEDLCGQDVDWNVFLQNSSQNRTQQEIDLYSFLDGFNNLEDVPIAIQSLKPVHSTVIYKNLSNSWFPKNFEKGIIGIDNFDLVRHSINSIEKL